MALIQVNKEALRCIARTANGKRYVSTAVEIAEDTFEIYVDGEVHANLLSKLSPRAVTFSDVIIGLINKDQLPN